MTDSTPQRPVLVTISQPRYLPALNYLARMFLADVFIYLDTVQYTRQDWENRNRIKTPQGPMWLVVPVEDEGLGQKIQDTRICHKRDWGKKHWNSIKQNYSKATHFKEHAPFFEDLYLKQKHTRLMDLNLALIDYLITSWGGTRCTFLLSSVLDPKASSQDMLADLTLKAGGQIYVSGPLGRDYITDGFFESKGLGLYYHDYKHPRYSQLHGDFLEYICALDLLFNEGKGGRELLLSGNEDPKLIKEKFSRFA